MRITFDNFCFKFKYIKLISYNKPITYNKLIKYTIDCKSIANIFNSNVINQYKNLSFLIRTERIENAELTFHLKPKKLPTLKPLKFEGIIELNPKSPKEDDNVTCTVTLNKPLKDQPRGIIDVGCGNGSWLSAVKELGVKEVLGIDGIYVGDKEIKVDKSEFLKKDLTIGFDLKKRFDLAISLEVAEHLPENKSDTIVDILVKHSDVILFSAAIPGQGGQYHFNEQWPEYWNKKFRDRGYVAYDILRDQFWDNDNVFWWYKQNILLSSQICTVI